MISERRRERMRAVAARRTRFATILLEGVHDPHNLAAILRTADAFGVQEVHAVEARERVRISNRVARGTQQWVDLFRYPGPDVAAAQLRARGYALWVAAAEPDAVPLTAWRPERPTAFVFGNEHRGVGPEVRARADRLFQIPMVGMVESLNVGVATAVTLATVRRAIDEVTATNDVLLDAAAARALVERWERRETMTA